MEGNLVNVLIGLMIAVIIGVVVAIPTVTTSISDANLTGNTATVVNLIPVLLALVLLVAVVRYLS